ncbi:MAG: hypothetical protein K0Q66_303 [Chitinophagaceae bacterium]|jgi:hypothetical protein|nr:hypothetical protein [Chitinophagaceae bacterium]
MHKQEYVQYLQGKLLSLKMQYLQEINTGKNLVLLQGLNGIIETLNTEIQLSQYELKNHLGRQDN